MSSNVAVLYRSTSFSFPSPMVGRWLNRDPIGENGGINRYGYVGNRPFNFNDPLGLKPPYGAVLYQAPDGSLFYAPPSANFLAQKAAGEANGYNLAGIQKAEGHGGIYDYQRQKTECGNKFKFIPDYTDASNFGVGVFMQGAGFSLNATLTISDTFAFFLSSNGMLGGNPVTEHWTIQGWYAAQQNNFRIFHKNEK